MTKRTKEASIFDPRQVGGIIQKRRYSMDMQNQSRQCFIDSCVNKGLLPAEWISEKTLTNIENGHNLPSLETLYKLSIALETDISDLMNEIIDQHISQS